MKKTKKLNFLEWNNHVLMESLRKLDWNILLVVFFDVLFYALSGFILFFWFQRVMEGIMSFKVPPDIISLGYERAQQLSRDVRLFYIVLVASLILVLIAIIFLASILKGIIWAKTTKTKITFALISKFLLLNLIWMGFWFVVILLISILFDPKVSALVIGATIVLSFYLTNTLYTIFMKEQRIGIIFKSIRISITKIHLFLFPYLITILLFFILVKISFLVKVNYSQIITSVLIIILIAIVRYYHSTLIFELGKQEQKNL